LWATPLLRCRSYYLADGSPLGKGFTSNANPYAHWAYNYFDTLQNNPAYNCTYANYYAKYHWVGARLLVSDSGRYCPRSCSSSMPH
jgi:hypothetical protein